MEEESYLGIVVYCYLIWGELHLGIVICCDLLRR